MASAYRTGAAPSRKAVAGTLGHDDQIRSDTNSDNDDPDTCLDVDKLIAGTIIPHLLLIRPTAPGERPAIENGTIHPDEALEFATLALTLEAGDLFDRVEAYLDRGVSAETIFLDLLAPAARRLGVMWQEDTCDFVDVTMGLWRLQEILRTVAENSPAIMEGAIAPRSIMLSPMPGEQHSFGTLMVEEVFARAGWTSEVLLEPRRLELLALVKDRSFDIVGLTLSGDCPSDALSEFINCLRSVSKNPDLIVMIGGRLVNSDPSMVDRAGADGTAVDASSALRLAEQLVARVRPLATASN
ncbi:cobalamin B12-binding domain-containing protein [Aurantiacibacter zhengii]|uniref:Cobalamin B12-binding protein n=1 Tax=Aurantiacibacter zhengii TaxID=2307003 RepID=A0A418NRB3_9SPHN|nr:cobalamin-dependent protein [Aurantiacibacter zhengii]RIV85606.1 cobalamin B12-binding protein [Aurantiacibacter zhengii]